MKRNNYYKNYKIVLYETDLIFYKYWEIFYSKGVLVLKGKYCLEILLVVKI